MSSRFQITRFKNACTLIPNFHQSKKKQTSLLMFTEGYYIAKLFK